MGETPQPVFTVGHRIPGVVRYPLDELLGLGTLERYYADRPDGLDSAAFLDWALERLQIDVRVDPRDLGRLPDRGPAIVVANHPFGALEGVVLARLVLERRRDVRVMANYMLGRIHELRDLFLGVDPFEGDHATRRNIAPTRAALRWLSDGGVVVLFPAGEVATLRADTGRVEDPPWSKAFALLARRSAATVVPAFFPGRNSSLFLALGMIHPRLRTAWLARALLAHRRRPLEVRFGSPLAPVLMSRLRDDTERTAYVRNRVEILRARVPGRPIQPRRTPREPAALAPCVSPSELAAEIDGLPEELMLHDSGEIRVHVARAGRIPLTLLEIGRLREMTFRAVGEGTGWQRDLDRFDETYRHLFLWAPRTRKIVGAYRLGAVDELLADQGIDGLYTATLFDFDQRIWSSMGPALEMGRSFVAPEFQRSYTPLMLLWKGIGCYVTRRPRYATLFGPVSISADYRSESQRMIVSFLERNRFAHDWSRWVRPRRPWKPARRARTGLDPASLRDLDDVSSFIAEIEADQKGVPVLLKQYLKLGGRLLGFNIDPEFANVLDVLLLVDLRRTERKILNRYMGRDGAETFLTHHRDASLETG